MKTAWEFIIKYEFWFSCLIIIGLYIGEYKMSEMWMREVAFVVFLIAGTRLASHPIWKNNKSEE